jgi:leader peptidase (prepilin peptidase)/N-methyltransferase
MTVYWAVVFTLLGMVFGSFFNVLADRLPAQKSIIKPPSHCPACGTRLKIPDLIPIVTYIFLRGRCRYCGASIPIRGFSVGSIYRCNVSGAVSHLWVNAELAIAIFYFSLLLFNTVTDLEHQLILNVIVYPAVITVLIINALTPGMSFTPGF